MRLHFLALSIVAICTIFPSGLLAANVIPIQEGADKKLKISAVDAIRIATKFTQDLKINTSDRFITKVQYLELTPDKKSIRPRWLVMYEPLPLRNSLGGEIWIYIDMNGQCTFELGQ